MRWRERRELEKLDCKCRKGDILYTLTGGIASRRCLGHEQPSVTEKVETASRTLRGEMGEEGEEIVTRRAEETSGNLPSLYLKNMWSVR